MAPDVLTRIEAKSLSFYDQSEKGRGIIARFDDSMLRASGPSAHLLVSEELAPLPSPPFSFPVSNAADRDVYPAPTRSNARRSKARSISAPAAFLAVLAVVFLLLHCSRGFVTSRTLGSHQRRLASGREGDRQTPLRSSDPQVCEETTQGSMFGEEKDSGEVISDVARAQISRAISILEKESLASGAQVGKRKAYGDPAVWPYSSQKAARLPGDRGHFDVRERLLHSQYEPQSPFQSPVVGIQSSHHVGSLAAQQPSPLRAHADYSSLYRSEAASSFERERLRGSARYHLGALAAQQQTPTGPHVESSKIFSGSSLAEPRMPAHSGNFPGRLASQQHTSLEQQPAYLSFQAPEAPSSTVPFSVPFHTSSNPAPVKLQESPLPDETTSSTSDESIALEPSLPQMPETTLDMYVREALQQDAETLLEPWLLDPDSLPPASPASETSQDKEEEEESNEAEALSAILFQLFKEAEDHESQQKPQTEPSPSIHTRRGSSHEITSRSTSVPMQTFLPASGALWRPEPPMDVATFYEKHPFYRLPETPVSLSLPALKYESGLGFESAGSLPRMLNSLQKFLAKTSLTKEEALALQKQAEELFHHAQHSMTDPIGGTMASKFDVPMSKRFLAADLLWSVCKVLGPSMKKEHWWNQLMDKMLADPHHWPPADRRRTARGQHVNRLLAAFRLYRAGERPAAQEVVEIKRAIFCGSKAPYFFRKRAWDSWRNLEDQYAAAVLSE
ncbi:hypothetical protein Emag_006465 [Eimeria magna]